MPGGALRLALPVEDVLEQEAAFVELARELTHTLAFTSGYAGFSFNRAEESELETTGREQSAALSHRWRGIDVEDLSTTLYAIRQGLKSAGWLTLVGRRLLDTLGGEKALAQALPDEVTVHTLPFRRADSGRTSSAAGRRQPQRGSAVVPRRRARPRPGAIARSSAVLCTSRPPRAKTTAGPQSGWRVSIGRTDLRGPDACDHC